MILTYILCLWVGMLVGWFAHTHVTYAKIADLEAAAEADARAP